jgi:nitrite reductase/ring-hydroxylating ferredoxin subunit
MHDAANPIDETDGKPSSPTRVTKRKFGRALAGASNPREEPLVTTDRPSAPPARNRPFSAYYNRPVADAESPLTKVGPGTPGGEYLRRFWHPFMLASELKDTPQAIRLLGEDLVVFRDLSGRLGLLHKPCIHRGVSLEFGIVTDRGIRCCYHGWHFGIDGTVIETPAEPSNSRIREQFCQGAYPVREANGLIFAYMGPPEAMPELPVYDTMSHPQANSLVPFQMSYPCNWVQIVENAADPIHNAYLHAIVSGQQFSPAFAVLPALDFVETPLGFLSMATRRVNDFVFIRASDIIMPNVAQFMGGSNTVTKEDFAVCAFLTRWVVPLDDHNSFYMGLFHLNRYTNPEGRIPREAFGIGKMGIIGQTADRPYVERQREPGDYDALVGQGVVANRRNEHLGTTDRGVVMFRRMLQRSIVAVERGETPALPRLYKGAPVRTYCHELVFTLPSQSNIGDLKSLGEFGRRAAGIVIETDTLPPDERETVAAARIRRLLGDNLVN